MMAVQRARTFSGLLAAVAAFGLAATALGQKQPPTYSGLAVCSKPGDRCSSSEKTFDVFELPFRLPKRLKANALYESVPFYAVVLRKEEDAPCDGGEWSVGLERFRIGAQTRFPDRKVFADHQCPNMAAVGYGFVGEKRSDKLVSFVAVYAGKTEAEGRAFLKTARQRFPQASLHRMRVSYSWIVQ